MDYNKIDIKTIPTNEMGSLSFFEGESDIPFQIKRIYFIHGVPKGTQRGGHAHKQLQQILFCPFGKIEILLDNGKKKESFFLDEPNKGLIIGNGIWREMIWHNSNSVLCVAASEYYDESDYIRNYDDFLKMVKVGI
ncbi:WxcM-like protein [Bacillus oleivorans]|uniref:WxcM-like protein n=1 Tax=Bacillus oleivorans TaxID=1448271 RepID=A0A285CHL1_9BACI|nr:FdtA/QdtA family cupin domain-containing protein [Bacillus oleivorans]SNX67084.1 WxcM-like protein [Bacillus oleivorans]